MGNSFSEPVSLAKYAPFVAIIASGVSLLQSASAAVSSAAAGQSVTEWVQGSCELNVGMLLLLALAVGAYVIQTLLPSKRKVFVLDFAVHTPHPR